MNRMRACAVIAYAGAFATFPFAARPATSDATQTVKKFYDWYLGLKKKFWLDELGQVKTLFDPTLYALLQTARRKEAAQHTAIIDFDPWAAAQWPVGSYALGAPVASGGFVQVPVNVTLEGRGGKTRLDVVLRKNAAGSYVIYNVNYHNPTYNLRDDLKKATQA